MRYRSPRRVVPWGLLRDDPSLGRFGLHLLASTRVTFLHTCFRLGFRHRFSSLLDGFWTPTWAYVGSFLAIFSLLSWGLILKSIFYRFYSIFKPPGTSKIELPPRRESIFQVFILLILRSLLDSVLAHKNHPKSSPRCFKIPLDMGSKI